MRAMVFSLLIFFILSGFAVAYAESPYYLKIEGITGESTAPGHEGWMAVSGLQSQASQGQSSPNPIEIVRYVDKASPMIMQAASTGKHIPVVIIDAVRADTKSPQTYMTIKLSNVVITSYTQIPATAGSLPQERIQLSFEKIEWIYNKQSAPARGHTQQPLPGASRGISGR